MSEPLEVTTRRICTQGYPTYGRPAYMASVNRPHGADLVCRGTEEDAKADGLAYYLRTHTCATCGHPFPLFRCVNPGCVESGNVPPEILAKRAKAAAEAEDRERFARIRSQSYGKGV